MSNSTNIKLTKAFKEEISGGGFLLSSIKRRENNPRSISALELIKLQKSIIEFYKMMPLRPIIYDETNKILGGTQRHYALEKMGVKEVPASWVKIAAGLSEAEKKEFILKDNHTFGDWDFLLLQENFELPEIKAWGLNDIAAGWETALSQKEKETGETLPGSDITEKDLDSIIEKAQELVKKYEIKPGDVWQLDKHFLICGDAVFLSYAEVFSLIKLNEKDIDSVWCDPPYGQDFVAKSSRMQKLGYTQYENDETIETAVNAYKLFDTWQKPMIFWGANHYASELPNSGGWFVWDKQGGKEGVNYSQAELAHTNFYKSVRTFTHIWDGFRRDSEAGQKRLHPAQKPVALFEWVYTEFLQDSKIVFDGFAGSGISIIGCENLKKQCVAVELQPEYVGIIIERWQKHTGKTASRAGNVTV